MTVVGRVKRVTGANGSLLHSRKYQGEESRFEGLAWGGGIYEPGIKFIR